MGPSEGGVTEKGGFGEGVSDRNGSKTEQERAASGLLKSALAAESISEFLELLRCHEQATSDVLDRETGSLLVRELSWAGRTEFADVMFRTLCKSGNEPSPQACFALVAAAHRKGDFWTTLRVFSTGRVRGVVFDRGLCISAIESCHRLGRWREAKAIFSDMGRCGIVSDTLAYNAVIMALGAARETREVQKIWTEMQSQGVQPNLQTYGLLISTFTKAELVENALEIYERLTKEGLQPSGLMYEGLVILLCRTKRDRMALNFYQEMRLSGLVLSHRGYAVLLSALAKGWVLDWESALQVYADMKADNVTLDVHHLTALLKVLALSRKTEAALEIWKEFLAAGVAPDLACYNSVIGVLRVVHNYDRAMDFFWEMKDRGIRPDQETYGNLIWACSEPALFKTALKLYEDMKAEGVAPNSHVFTGLYTTMGRAGEWQTALELWKEMRSLGIKPSPKTYNAMIGCLGRCKKPELMLKAHRQMLDEGVRPDDTTRHFLGKFGPPKTAQNSQTWGPGNMGERVELKHYSRGGREAPGSPGEVTAPEEKYRRGGVLHSLRRQDPGWVRSPQESRIAEERRGWALERARARGDVSEKKAWGGETEDMGAAGSSGEGGQGGAQDEWEWVREDEEEAGGVSEASAKGEDRSVLSTQEGLRKGEGHGPGVRKEGQSRQASEKDGRPRKAAIPKDEPRVVDGRKTEILEDGVMEDSEKSTVSRKKGRREKDSGDEEVPLWQRI